MFLQKNDPQAPPLKFGVISKEDLLHMGASSIAYIKPQAIGGFRVYAANGLLIDEEPDIRSAFQEIRSKNMVCVTVH